MEELIKRVQKMLVDEYRLEHPEFSDYSDEEIALINPVSEPDIIYCFRENGITKKY